MIDRIRFCIAVPFLLIGNGFLCIGYLIAGLHWLTWSDD